MARSNKPFVYTINEQGKTISIDYPTYRDLVKDMKQILNNFLNNRHKDWDFYNLGSRGRQDYVSVYRSKRGEWGQWFEHWKLVDMKPVKIKEGWL